jgi:hypothetical protein
VQDLQTVTSEFKITAQEIDDFVNQFISDDLEYDIDCIVSRFTPKIDDYEKRLNERAEEGIGFVQELFAHVPINQDGMPKATLDLSIHENRIANEIHNDIPIQAQFLNFVIPKFIETHNLTPEEFAGFLSNTPIHLKEYEPFLTSGIRYYFQKDYVAMIHTLIPYVEATLRNIINKIGLNIYKPNKKNGYDAILLGDILAIEQLKNEVLGEDVHFYFKLVYNDTRGLNLRNIIAHGLATPSMFNVSNANIIVHTLMILSRIRNESKT